MKLKSYIFLLVIFCFAENIYAQSSYDEVWAVWGADGFYNVLYSTHNGDLIYKLSKTKSDTSFYERETLSLRRLSYVSMQDISWKEYISITLYTAGTYIVQER